MLLRAIKYLYVLKNKGSHLTALSVLRVRVELCLWQQRSKALQLHIRVHMCSISSKFSDLAKLRELGLVRLGLLFYLSFEGGTP